MLKTAFTGAKFRRLRASHVHSMCIRAVVDPQSGPNGPWGLREHSVTCPHVHTAVIHFLIYTNGTTLR